MKEATRTVKRLTRHEGVQRVLGERAQSCASREMYTLYTLYTRKKITRAAACENCAACPSADVTRAPSFHCEVMVYRVYRVYVAGVAHVPAVHLVHLVHAADPDRVPAMTFGPCSLNQTGKPQHWARSAALALRSCGLAAHLPGSVRSVPDARKINDYSRPTAHESRGSSVEMHGSRGFQRGARILAGDVGVAA